MVARTALLLTIGSLIGAAPALAQGATGAVSRPGWSRGAAPSSDFNAQSAPLSRTEALLRRAADARQGQGAAPIPTRRRAHH